LRPLVRVPLRAALILQTHPVLSPALHLRSLPVLGLLPGLLSDRLSALRRCKARCRCGPGRTWAALPFCLQREHTQSRNRRGYCHGAHPARIVHPDHVSFSRPTAENAKN
jgi:hypothetical protein